MVLKNYKGKSEMKNSAEEKKKRKQMFSVTHRWSFLQISFLRS